MTPLDKEIKANFCRFSAAWKDEMLTVLDSLAEDSRFLQSYRRLTTFQAWRTHLDGRVSSDSLEFFLEAQTMHLHRTYLRDWVLGVKH